MFKLTNTKTGKSVRFAELLHNKATRYFAEALRSITVKVDGKSVKMVIHPTRENIRVNCQLTAKSGKVINAYTDDKDLRDAVAKKVQGLSFTTGDAPKAAAKKEVPKGTSKPAAPAKAPTPKVEEPKPAAAATASA